MGGQGGLHWLYRKYKYTFRTRLKADRPIHCCYPLTMTAAAAGGIGTGSFLSVSLRPPREIHHRKNDSRLTAQTLLLDAILRDPSGDSVLTRDSIHNWDDNIQRDFPDDPYMVIPVRSTSFIQATTNADDRFFRVLDLLKHTGPNLKKKFCVVTLREMYMLVASAERPSPDSGLLARVALFFAGYRHRNSIGPLSTSEFPVVHSYPIMEVALRGRGRTELVDIFLGDGDADRDWARAIDEVHALADKTNDEEYEARQQAERTRWTTRGLGRRAGS